MSHFDCGHDYVPGKKLCPVCLRNGQEYGPSYDVVETSNPGAIDVAIAFLARQPLEYRWDAFKQLARDFPTQDIRQLVRDENRRRDKEEKAYRAKLMEVGSPLDPIPGTKEWDKLKARERRKRFQQALREAGGDHTLAREIFNSGMVTVEE
jgi:hypothetical protein